MINKNYIIQAHQSPLFLKQLINRLDDGYSTFFIHIDRKTDINPFVELINDNYIHFIDKRVDCIWGDYSQVEATCNLIEAVVKSKKLGVTIFLSGQDYPIKTNEYINDFLSNKSDTNFISYFNKKLTKDSLVYKERLKLYKINNSSNRNDFILLGKPIYLSYNNWKRIIKFMLLGKFKLQYFKYFFKERKDLFKDYGKGSQWWAFQNKTLNLIYDYIKNNKYELDEYFKYSFAVDEIFFHSILYNINDLKIEDNLTYINWNFRELVIDESKFKFISEGVDNKLFARKFNVNNKTILNLIDNKLLSK